MRIGTITLTLKKSPVDCQPAAGGPLLKGRNVSRAVLCNHDRKINPEMFYHYSRDLFLLCGSHENVKMVLQNVDWISGSSLVLEIRNQKWENVGSPDYRPNMLLDF